MNVRLLILPGRRPGAKTAARILTDAFKAPGVEGSLSVIPAVGQTGEPAWGRVLSTVYRTTAPASTGAATVSAAGPESNPPLRENATSSSDGGPEACTPVFFNPGLGVSKYP